MDPNKTSQNWHTYNPRPSTHAPVTLPSTPTTQQSQYPHIQPRPQSQPPIQHHGQSNSPTVQFHHYQPPMKQAPPPLAQYPVCPALPQTIKMPAP
ncbi:hypothetical protein BU23DRAFT_551156 [Bimuria novae-zelandiae CBS 107.79]|uniref:Uncharacterized protein n=1 Tax=Bimuria novae-zelandiae CBS 107.79 TaxID=1447943 RepID=A0A6A5VNI7_9PLEO|nr:hypothetical protein BU23DRAFT_551156 [Bimuria novae-zelandiae CBS 107.79]